MKALSRCDESKHRRTRPQAVELWRDTCGAIAVEYGLIAALIALVIIGSIKQLGESLFGLPLQALIHAFLGSLS